MRDTTRNILICTNWWDKSGASWRLVTFAEVIEWHFKNRDHFQIRLTPIEGYHNAMVCVWMTMQFCEENEAKNSTRNEREKRFLQRRRWESVCVCVCVCVCVWELEDLERVREIKSTGRAQGCLERTTQARGRLPRSESEIRGKENKMIKKSGDIRLPITHTHLDTAFFSLTSIFASFPLESQTVTLILSFSTTPPSDRR